MATKNIAPLTSNASKQAEIFWLEQVANAVGDNTYLKSLFTPELIEWVTEQIKSDISCDLYGAMLYRRDAEIARLTAEVETLKTQDREHYMDSVRRQERVHELTSRIAAVEQANDELHARMNIFYDQLIETQQTAAEENERANSAENLLRQQEQRIAAAKRQLEIAPMFADNRIILEPAK